MKSKLKTKWSDTGSKTHEECYELLRYLTTESTQHTVKCTAREKLDATLLEILIPGGAGPRDLRAGLSRLALIPP